MRSLPCFWVMVLLAAAIKVAVAVASDARSESVGNIQTNPRSGLSQFSKKGGNLLGFPSMESREGVNNSSKSNSNRRSSRNEKGGRGGEEQSEDINRGFKICLNKGRCFMKRLVCPINCKRSLRGLGNNHFPGHCIFNCHKCKAYC